MIWTGIAIFSIIIIFTYFFFQPLHIVVPGRDEHHPNQELHVSEDIRSFLHGDNKDVSVHYHNSHEDKQM